MEDNRRRVQEDINAIEKNRQDALAKMDESLIAKHLSRPLHHSNSQPCSNCGYNFLNAPASPLVSIRQPRTRKGKGKATGYVCKRCIELARTSQVAETQPAKPRRGRPRKTA